MAAAGISPAAKKKMPTTIRYCRRYAGKCAKNLFSAKTPACRLKRSTALSIVVWK